MSDVRLEITDDRIAIVTITRPQRRNALSANALAALHRAFDAIAARADVRAAVVTGEGVGFCAGADMKATPDDWDDTAGSPMGDLLGHAVRFGIASSVMAAGEGIETMLSLRSVLPTMPMAAALSAAHLAAILFPDTLRRLYIARDDDPAGDGAMATLIDRADQAGIEAIMLSPALGDFNEDLRVLGTDALRAAIRVQIAPQDVARFMELAA